MKVAHIVPSFFPAVVYGGPTESVYHLCRATANAGLHVRVLTTNANGSADILDVPTSRDVVMQERLSVRYCRRTLPESISMPFLTFLPSLIRWSDVVHLEAVYSFPTIPTLLWARLLNKPVVWTPRGALSRWGGARNPRLKDIYDALCRMSKSKNVRFHFTSQKEQEGSLWRFPSAQGVVIPNGVEIRTVTKAPRREKQIRLVYLGRLDPIKGIENLLEACNRLKDWRTTQWTLILAGSGDVGYTAKIKARIHELGIAERVRTIGRVDGHEKENVFALADVVIVPSHLENFCIVAAEALARGIPVIASRGTPWQGLESQGCGLWVENDPKSLADAIEQISRMPLDAMGERGRAWMKADFSWEKIAKQMIRLYEELAR